MKTFDAIKMRQELSEKGSKKYTADPEKYKKELSELVKKYEHQFKGKSKVAGHHP